MQLHKDFFRYDFNEPTTYAFHALALGYFAKVVMPKRTDKLNSHLFFRLFRLGLLGDILFKSASLKVTDDTHDPNHELLAAFFESYLALARSVYDYLLFYLKDQYGVKESSFNRFVKKLDDGDYSEIEGKFRDFLKSKSFNEFRNLRDSSIHKTSNLMIYVKEDQFFVDGTVYDNEGNSERFDESLYSLIFRYTTSLMLLMSYISEKETGVTLSGQLKHLMSDKDNLTKKG